MLSRNTKIDSIMSSCQTATPVDPTLIEKSQDIHAHLVNLGATLPHFKVLSESVDPILKEAARFKNFKDVLVLGTGGSSLGGQTLCALRAGSKPNIHFMDNIDAAQFTRVISSLEAASTGVIGISKSGNTAETLMQLLTLRSLWPSFDWPAQSLIITEPKPNAITEFAVRFGIEILPHPEDIGGRYSAFTLVGLLPAAIAGVDIGAVRLGARAVVEQLPNIKPKECAPVVSAIQHVHFMMHNVNQSVMLAYSEALSIFAAWYAQLWGESIGKKNPRGQGVGSTPVRAIGAVDQHSQLQLYLDGPRDKFFTVLTLQEQGKSPPVSTQEFTHPAITCFDGKTMGDLMRAEQKATIDTLTAKGCYVRHMEAQCWDEENLGTLMAHFILETLATAYLLEVDPFDQPAVEDGKKLAIEYLNKGV
jgi:glucose-6-phosphate isomerase